ncbi:MAG: hypothetical protein QOG03_1589 [Actinomycetota bacterium]|jgi:hypothetical protein|nr:hypothetical protein [Actinomycetota bacterium]
MSEERWWPTSGGVPPEPAIDRDPGRRKPSVVPKGRYDLWTLEHPGRAAWIAPLFSFAIAAVGFGLAARWSVPWLGVAIGQIFIGILNLAIGASRLRNRADRWRASGRPGIQR